MKMTAQMALDALKAGDRVTWQAPHSFFFKMYQNDAVVLLKQETACSACFCFGMNADDFLTRYNVTDFTIYDS